MKGISSSDHSLVDKINNEGAYGSDRNSQDQLIRVSNWVSYLPFLVILLLLFLLSGKFLVAGEILDYSFHKPLHIVPIFRVYVCMASWKLLS